MVINRTWILLACSSLLACSGCVVQLAGQWLHDPHWIYGFGGLIAVAGVVGVGTTAGWQRGRGQLTMRALLTAVVAPILVVWFCVYPVRYAFVALQCASGVDFDSCERPRGFVDGLLGGDHRRLLTKPIVEASYYNQAYAIHQCISEGTSTYCSKVVNGGYIATDELCAAVPRENMNGVGWWCDEGADGKLFARPEPLDVWF